MVFSSRLRSFGDKSEFDGNSMGDRSGSGGDMLKKLDVKVRLEFDDFDSSTELLMTFDFFDIGTKLVVFSDPKQRLMASGEKSKDD